MRGRVERDCIETCENVVRSGAIIKFVDFDSSTSTFTGYSDIAVDFLIQTLVLFSLKILGEVYIAVVYLLKAPHIKYTSSLQRNFGTSSRRSLFELLLIMMYIS